MSRILFALVIAAVLYFFSYGCLRSIYTTSGRDFSYVQIGANIGFMKPKRNNSYGLDYHLHRFLETIYFPLTKADTILTGHRTGFYNYIAEVDFSEPSGD